MTRHDFQANAKKAGRPWEIAKSLEASAPTAPFVSMPGATGIPSAPISLAVNGGTR